MASTLATVDPQAKVQVKSPHGVVSLPAHQAHGQNIPTIEVVNQFSATTLGTWSSYSELTLQPQQLPHLVDTVTIALTLGAGSKTGGTYIALCGDANWLFKSVEVYAGANLLQTLYAENGFIQSIAHYSDEYKAKVLPAAGNATLSTRKTNTAAGQVLYYNVPVGFLIKKTGFFSGSSSGALRFRFYHQDLPTIVVTDGTVPVLPINSLTMSIAGRNYASQASAAALVANQKKMGSMSTRWWAPVQQQIVLPSGSSTYTLQLTNLVGNFSHIFFVIRAQSSVGTPLGNTPDAFLSLATYQLNDSAGNIILPSITSAYALGPLLGRYTTGDFTAPAQTLGPTGTPYPVYPLFFSSDPEKALFEGVSVGSLKLDGLSRLTINFASAISSAYVVDFVGFVHQELQADATGNIKSVLVA